MALSKKEILSWYERAKKDLEARRVGRHPLRPKLSEQDYQAYGRSIERYFKQLKMDFNRRLKCQKT